MASKTKKVRDFQIDLLKFLVEKNVPEVHIYHHVMNCWSNDYQMLPLQMLKEAVTELCDKKFIVSKNNAHNSIGVQGMPEEDQKNNAICSIQQPGLVYLKKVESAKKMKNAVAIFLIIAALFAIWYYRSMIRYFFR
jgi:hypothetical protein